MCNDAPLHAHKKYHMIINEAQYRDDDQMPLTLLMKVFLAALWLELCWEVPLVDHWWIPHDQCFQNRQPSVPVQQLPCHSPLLHGTPFLCHLKQHAQV
jgi:hypothetical protein